MLESSEGTFHSVTLMTSGILSTGAQQIAPFELLCNTLAQGSTVKSQRAGDVEPETEAPVLPAILAV